ncbi:putative acyltransferase YihG [Saliniradius amylolyticus]|uniref:Putative acyltransferase YihG n=1 Tax=Saliniradius amylolyticus TaxID=2183582 RepID=A0A2S2E0S5_9ALTE|nr:acyltransferase [Saliniradius amylolyticus]AWL11255.1 putative acyltransferase YihG [Saliniradius amylolyticus]
MKNLVGVFSVLGYGINTLFWFVPIILLSLLKLIPIRPWQTVLTRILDRCATSWVSINNLNQKLTGGTQFDVKGLNPLTPKEWYLVIANHQSWVDILVLQRVFNRKIPFLKFFLKRELIWVPFLGLAWWALDFPFMRRYKKAFLEKYPHKKGKDLETTRAACEKFRFKPVSIMNFVEGTRFTPQKHAAQNSPFDHLLRPKAGGIAFVLNAMGDKLHQLLDVTIHYPQGAPSFWDFVCGKVKQIQVRVKVTSLDNVLPGDYFDSEEQKLKFQQWLNQRWQQKDALLETLERATCSKEQAV